MLRRADAAQPAPPAVARPSRGDAATGGFHLAPDAIVSEREPIWVSYEDAAVLDALLSGALAGRDAATALFLGNELSRAQLAPHAELPECMTLGARGRVLLEPTGEVRDCVLVPPAAAHEGASLISVLSETGAALLGLSAGQRFDWRCPRRGVRALRLLSVSRPLLPLPSLAARPS
jgi:regulator of nucleoside diphosphate kinase